MPYEDAPKKAVYDSQGKEAWRGDDGAMRNPCHLSEAASFNMGVGGQEQEKDW
jgi:hypothetical protein